MIINANINQTSGWYEWTIPSCLNPVTNTSGVITSNIVSIELEPFTNCNEEVICLNIYESVDSTEPCDTLCINVFTGEVSQDTFFKCIGIGETSNCIETFQGPYTSLGECQDNCGDTDNCNDVVVTTNFLCEDGLGINISGYTGIVTSVYTTPHLEGFSNIGCEGSPSGTSCLFYNETVSNINASNTIIPSGTYSFNVVIELPNGCIITSDAVTINCEGGEIPSNISCCSGDIIPEQNAGIAQYAYTLDISNLDNTQDLIIDFLSFEVADRMYVCDENDNIIADLGYIGLSSQPCNASLSVTEGYHEVVGMTSTGNSTPSNYTWSVGQELIIPKDCNNTVSDVETVQEYGRGRIILPPALLTGNYITIKIDPNTETICTGGGVACTAWAFNVICPDCNEEPVQCEDINIIGIEASCEEFGTTFTINYESPILKESGTICITGPDGVPQIIPFVHSPTTLGVVVSGIPTVIGEYQITIKIHDCESSATVQAIQCPLCDLELQGSVSCNEDGYYEFNISYNTVSSIIIQDDTNTVIASVPNQSPPYTPIFTNLNPNTFYTVVVDNNKGCTDTIDIIVPDCPCIELTGSLECNTNFEWNLNLSWDTSDEVTLTINGNPQQVTGGTYAQTFTNPAPGDYTISVEKDGCIDTIILTVDGCCTPHELRDLVCVSGTDYYTMTIYFPNLTNVAGIDTVFIDNTDVTASATISNGAGVSVVLTDTTPLFLGNGTTHEVCVNLTNEDCPKCITYTAPCCNLNCVKSGVFIEQDANNDAFLNFNSFIHNGTTYNFPPGTIFESEPDIVSAIAYMNSLSIATFTLSDIQYKEESNGVATAGSDIYCFYITSDDDRLESFTFEYTEGGSQLFTFGSNCLVRDFSNCCTDLSENITIVESCRESLNLYEQLTDAPEGGTWKLVQGLTCNCPESPEYYNSGILMTDTSCECIYEYNTGDCTGSSVTITACPCTLDFTSTMIGCNTSFVALDLSWNTTDDLILNISNITQGTTPINQNQSGGVYNTLLASTNPGDELLIRIELANCFKEVTLIAPTCP